MSNSPSENIHVLAFGAHPDDIEFGCGGVLARESFSGRRIHLVICSRGEAGTHGTPDERVAEAHRGAFALKGTGEFIELDGDARLEIRSAHALKIAGIIRSLRPDIVLAPTVVQNQHPDHWKLGQLVREAARLARFGGLEDLKSSAPHSIGQLFFYAITPSAEPVEIQPILIDVSTQEVVDAWTAAMEAHSSQAKTRDYTQLQLARAKVNGGRCGTAFAMALYPDDPLVFESLASLSRGARNL